MNDVMEERRIVRDVLSGNRESFALLVRAHEGLVRSLCLSILRNSAEADDAAQEVFVKAFKSLGSFRSDASFSSWMYRIAYRHCVDVIRSGRRRRTEALDAMDVDQFRERTSSTDDRLDVRRALELLSPDERMVLTLREVQGLTYEEISEVLEVSLDGVKGRLKRARRSLQEKARHLFQVSNV
jgi:RNA polymerase sigma-70 factor (ECF subfamily)